MTEPFDPFEVLAELDPVDPAAVRGATSSLRARAALEKILDDPGPLSLRTRIRRRALLPTRRRIYVVAAVALSITAAGAAWALTRAPTHQLTIGCYAADSLSADTVVVPEGQLPPDATCRAVWQRGDFGALVPARLEACVLASGAIGVFPSPDGQACQRLKLSPAATTPAAQGSATALKNALALVFLSHRCLSRRSGIDAARAELRALNLAGWDVHVITPFTQQRSCTSFAFDEDRQLVLIVPIPPQP